MDAELGNEIPEAYGLVHGFQLLFREHAVQTRFKNKHLCNLRFEIHECGRELFFISGFRGFVFKADDTVCWALKIYFPDTLVEGNPELRRAVHVGAVFTMGRGCSKGRSAK